MSKNILAMAFLAFMLAGIVSCGGGGISTTGIGKDEEIGLARKPAPGRANLAGTVVSAGGLRAFSQAGGTGLAGAAVALINIDDAAVVGSGITDGSGKFEFEDVPSGDGYMLRLELESSADLDGDGEPDEAELFTPVRLGDRALAEIDQQLAVSDSDGDSSPDAIEVLAELSDDSGSSSIFRSQHRRRAQLTVIDHNGNGSFADDSGFADTDSDGLADAHSPLDSDADNGVGWCELEIMGMIGSISGSGITVGQVSYKIDQLTSWRIGGNRNASPALFSPGMYVEIEGRPDGSGGWIATKVRAEDAPAGGGSEDDPPAGAQRNVRGLIETLTAEAITVGGIEFALTSHTTWRIGDNRNADPALFSVGMYVEVEGTSDGAGGWNAGKVQAEK